MLRIWGIHVPLDGDEQELRRRTAALLGVDPEDIGALTVVRRAVDARRGRVRWCYTVEAALSSGEAEAIRRGGGRVRSVENPPRERINPRGPSLIHRPVVVGAGPAGLFAALRLAEYGYRPLVLERGPAVADRARAVRRFFETGILDPDANIAFGEGGAGAWSDGKLTTRARDPLCRLALERLVAAGAPADILTDAHPHIGTDGLHEVVVRLRRAVEELGGTCRFGAAVEDLVLREGRVAGVTLRGGEAVPAEAVILAVGHSARDTLESLLRTGVALEARGFAVGVRIEHPQNLIDRIRYGGWAGHPLLGAAEYGVKTAVDGRPVYSFCMCPGGVVVNASSEPDGLCVNGMSVRARDGANANAAVVCAIEPGGDGPLSGMRFQRRLERAAWRAGGGGYMAPAQRLADFLEGRAGRHFGGVTPTVRPGAVPADLAEVLPGPVAGALRRAFGDFDRELPGFLLPDAVLTAVETRTSSPARMTRDETGQSVSAEGLYPAGEGAGYAGGILSAAADGIRAAERLMTRRRPSPA